MGPTPHDIEAGLQIPAEVSEPAMAYAEAQDARRGDWPSPREARQPQPPWPETDNPMLRLLVHKAVASINAGMDTNAALLQLAVHAWFEGGVEGYDRGQRDAHRPRPVE